MKFGLANDRSVPLVKKTVGKLAKKPLLLVLHGYKRWLSPILPPACRFSPSCSEYAAECLQRYSLGKALSLTLRRLGRCQPFHPGGYDPVPAPPK